MNPRENRRIWIVTKDGTPQYAAWGLYKTWDEAPADGNQSRDTVLDAGQSTDPAWDATPTAWRNMPGIVRGRFGKRISTSLDGRSLRAIGLEFDLDRGGLPNPEHTAKEPVEPDAPNPVVVDEGELLEAIEAIHAENVTAHRTNLEARLGGPLDPQTERMLLAIGQGPPTEFQHSFVEHGTGKGWLVSSDPDAVMRGQDDVLVKRLDGAAHRSDRAP